MNGNSNSHWVFGYGSLIWRPGFPFVGAQRALLRGAHRRLCIYSHHYRGTPEQPGLVFGLVRGGSCHGMAFEVAPSDWPEVLAYLKAREQISGVYREAYRPVRLHDGAGVTALTFIVNEAHAQYAGRLTIADELELVRHASGEMGRNTDYVVNTHRHLEEMGIADAHLGVLSTQLLAT
jgi:cation transport protein ChaC